MPLAQAAVSAAAIRLRPILMTVLCMAIGTLALLFVVPVLFIVFQAMEERLMPARKHED